MKYNLYKSTKGLTLIEIIVMIIILGILSTTVLVKYTDFSNAAKKGVEDGVVGAIRGGINMLYAKNQSYPAQLDSASDGEATPANPFFGVVLTQAITKEWSKNGAFYKAPSNRSYCYNPTTGKFIYSSSLGLMDGTVAIWSMQEGTGNTANNTLVQCSPTAPQIFQGNLVGAAWNNIGGRQGLHFDGNHYVAPNVTDYVSVPNSASLNLTDKGTVSTWIYMDTTPGAWAGILHKGTATNFSDEAYSMQFYNGKLSFGFNNDLSSYLVTNTTLNPGQWYQITATWDNNAGPDKGTKIYVNGELVASDPTKSRTARISSGDLIIGAQLDKSYSPSYKNLGFNGSITDVGLFNRALTAAEIQSYYNSTK